MSAACAINECACCDAALVRLPEFSFCPACGFITTDAAGAAAEIAELRRQLSATAGGEISIDVPNALPAVNEGAWWEMCGGRAVAAFTPGSLARFVRADGLEISTLSLADDDGGRRVHLTAARAAGPTRPRFDIEDDLGAVTAAVDAFPVAVERQVARWRRVIDEMLGDEKHVVVCGSEAATQAFLGRLQIGQSRVARLIDASSAPEVVIALGKAAAEVRHELRQLGLRPLVLTP